MFCSWTGALIIPQSQPFAVQQFIIPTRLTFSNSFYWVHLQLFLFFLDLFVVLEESLPTARFLSSSIKTTLWLLWEFESMFSFSLSVCLVGCLRDWTTQQTNIMQAQRNNRRPHFYWNPPPPPSLSTWAQRILLTLTNYELSGKVKLQKHKTNSSKHGFNQKSTT